MAMTSVVIVGAGAFGAGLADKLARDGWDVTLVEQHEPGDPRA
jgi:sarcosine oxidase